MTFGRKIMNKELKAFLIGLATICLISCNKNEVSKFEDLKKKYSAKKEIKDFLHDKSYKDLKGLCLFKASGDTSIDDKNLLFFSVAWFGMNSDVSIQLKNGENIIIGEGVKKEITGRNVPNQVGFFQYLGSIKIDHSKLDFTKEWSFSIKDKLGNVLTQNLVVEDNWSINQQRNK